MKIPKIFASIIAFSKFNVAPVATGLLALALCVPSAPAQDTPTQSQPKPSATNPNASEKPDGKAFTTPESAAFALRNAVEKALEKDDEADLLVVLGPSAKDLIQRTDDDARDEQRRLFVHNYDRLHRLVHEPDGTVALYVGPENWPLPIPLIEVKGAWYFDANLGEQEILYRQVGRNEMEALEVCHALIDAEKEYYGVAHKFTAQFVSGPASRDGLYWKTNGAAKSPIGPYLAQAGVADSTANHQPFHGYFYRILLQSPVAPNGDTGGSASTMNSAFVVEAFPAMYRKSGVMTFLVDENGNVHEKDLGTNTAKSALQITSAHPDQSWAKVD
jgi:hypothetical protein